MLTPCLVFPESHRQSNEQRTVLYGYEVKLKMGRSLKPGDAVFGYSGLPFANERDRIFNNEVC